MISQQEKWIKDLSPAKRSLLEIKLKNRAASHPSVSIIPKRKRFNRVPLSFSQQRLWFLKELDPDSSAYNVATTLKLKGALNEAILNKALDLVVGRQESLRTTFIIENEFPVQLITESQPAELFIKDFSHLAASEREAECRKYILRETQYIFDLRQSPLFRCSLLKIDDEEHIFLLTNHHIISDGWSMAVFFRELTASYESLLKEESPDLPELPIQYADYAIWQSDWLKGDEPESQLGYWKKQLEGSPPILKLPTDYPRPPVQTFSGAQETIKLSKELTESLKALSQQENATLFMTLLAAFKILLLRYTGQEDFCVGTPVAGRTRTETESLIGPLINTLVLRVDLSGNPGFKELLKRVRQVSLDAYNNQDIPFEKLVEELQPERNLSYTPIFQVMFNYRNVPDKPKRMNRITLAPFEIDRSTSKFDLTLDVTEMDEGLFVLFEYRTDLFTKERIEVFIRQYRFLLKQIVEDPEKQIRNYSLVTHETRLLLPNPKEVISEPRQELVSNMFFSWARQTPEKTALTMGGHTWCYSELAECVENLAKVLVSMEVKRGDVVAIMGQKSFGLIVSISGTLLSRGVILLIDSNLPEQRKLLMLSEANARRIIYVGEITSEDRWIENKPEIDILIVEAFTGKTVETERYRKSKSLSLPVVTPEDAAYIFFTSGTTGKPKGILGSHKGLSHFLAWQRDEYAVGPGDRVAQLTNRSFDVVLRDIFLPLTSGGTLCIPEDIQGTAPDRVLSWLEHENITILHLVPSIANAWLDELSQGLSLKNLRCVFFAGEPLSEELVMRWRNTFPESGELINLYGPTETTLAKCFYEVSQNINAGIQSIGRPLPDTQALVFSKDNVLCGIGETGEIVIRTPFRTEGYINDKEEKKSRFIKNPYRDDEEDLFYYTGDLGRYRPDGSLDILGRLDCQVKILGVRVEPEEVGVALSKHPSVKSCVVIAGNNKDNQKYLIGYVVLSKGLKAAVHDLRLFLSRELPAAMVPSIIIFLDSIPLTLNGKVDRKALPRPDVSDNIGRPDFVMPETGTEKLLAKIWQEVIGVDKVSLTDNFFELGGHSLMAVRLFSRIHKVTGINLPLATLFKAPTIEKLAVELSTTNAAKVKEAKNTTEALIKSAEEKNKIFDRNGSIISSNPWASLVTIQPKGSNPPLFCIAAVGGNVLNYFNLVPYLGTNQPVYGLQSQGLDGISKPLQDIETIAAHYIKEIRTLQHHGPYYLCGGSFGGTVAFEMAQQLKRAGEEIAFLVMFDTMGPNYTRKSKPRLNRYLDNISFRINEILALKPKGKILYIRDYVTDKLLNRFYWIPCLMYRMLRRPIPHHLRYFYIEQVNIKALRKYKPGKLSGKFTLFRCPTQPEGIYSDPMQGWKGMTTEDIKIIEIPGTHRSFVEEPMLGKQLDLCLREIHSTINK